MMSDPEGPPVSNPPLPLIDMGEPDWALHQFDEEPYRDPTTGRTREYGFGDERPDPQCVCGAPWRRNGCVAEHALREKIAAQLLDTAMPWPPSLTASPARPLELVAEFIRGNVRFTVGPHGPGTTRIYRSPAGEVTGFMATGYCASLDLSVPSSSNPIDNPYTKLFADEAAALLVHPQMVTSPEEPAGPPARTEITTRYLTKLDMMATMRLGGAENDSLSFVALPQAKLDLENAVAEAFHAGAVWANAQKAPAPVMVVADHAIDADGNCAACDQVPPEARSILAAVELVAADVRYRYRMAPAEPVPPGMLLDARSKTQLRRVFKLVEGVCSKHGDPIRVHELKEALFQQAPMVCPPGCTIPDRPRMVVLCGSTRFADAFRKANLEETLAGRMVLSIGCDMRSDAEVFAGVDSEELDLIKDRLDTLHKRKIDAADEVLVLNVGGYVGESTRSEIAYARALGKPIRWLEEVQVHV